MESNYKLTLKVKRYDPDSGKSWVQDYGLEVGRILPGMELVL
jgi:succinate dehydrogenase/fumarate reductase-like Fe-S protein